MQNKENPIDFDASISGRDNLKGLLFTRLRENFPSNGPLGQENDLYRFNSYNYRSDEFKKDHTDLHVLFMGCSVTMGIGLKQEEMWTTKLLEKINSDTKVSGNFNIAKYGYSSYSCINAAFKYFKEIGLPDIIFYNVPNFSRAHKVTNDGFASIQVLTKNDDNRLISIFNKSHIFTFFQTYNMLELFCKMNGIRLISFSWDTEESNDSVIDINTLISEYVSTNDIFKNFYNFDTFYGISGQHVTNYVLNEQAKRKLQFGITARDNAHFGELYHEYWADILFDIYRGIFDFQKVYAK